MALRKGDYKYVYAEQRMAGTMGVWAEPFTKLRLQKTFNLFQDPFERADITSNTFWDWQINHVGQIYGAMDDVFQFALTFKEFPPRSFPPSFMPTNIVEETLDDIKEGRARAGDRARSIDRIRSGVQQMIEQQLQQRGVSSRDVAIEPVRRGRTGNTCLTTSTRQGGLHVCFRSFHAPARDVRRISWPCCHRRITCRSTGPVRPAAFLE